MAKLNSAQDAQRSQILYGNERALYSHLGFFLSNFNSVQFWLGELYFQITGGRDMTTDPRVRCGRLQIACSSSCPVGPNLAPRIKYLERDIIPTHAKLMSTKPWYMDDKIYFATNESIPNGPPGMPEPDSILIDDLFEQSIWLNNFGSDLLTIIKGFSNVAAEAKPKICEISNPISDEPSVISPSPLVPSENLPLGLTSAVKIRFEGYVFPPRK